MTQDFLEYLREQNISVGLGCDPCASESTEPERLSALTGNGGESASSLQPEPSVDAAGNGPERVASRNSAIVLSPGQEGLWFLHRILPNKSALNLAFAFRVRGPINTEAFDTALQQVVQRHDVLRLTFAGDDPSATVAQGVEVRCTRMSLEDEDEQLRLAVAERFVMGEVRQPFALGRAPLMRVGLIQLSSADHVLWVVTSRLVFDRASTQVFVEDLRTAYEALPARHPAAQHSLPFQFQHYASWQRQLCGPGALESVTQWWHKSLPLPLPVLDLPGERNRPSMKSYEGSSVQCSVSSDLAEALRSLAQSQGCTVQTLLMAAFGVLLYRVAGHESIIVGVLTASREWQETRSLVGCFENTVPVKLRFQADVSFADFLRDASASSLDATHHARLPFEQLVRGLDRGHDPSRSPICQALFGYNEETDTPSSQFGAATLEQIYLPSIGAMSDLTLLVNDLSSGMQLVLEYSTDIFDISTVGRFLERYQVLLQQISVQPASALQDLLILSKQEATQIRQWTFTEVPFAYVPVHRQIEAQVAANPRAIAVEFENQRTSYEELNSQANHLARSLIAAGARKGELIGIFMERSPLMIVALLAVHKAGAGYVPLDPSYPADRLAFVVEDSRLSVLIVSSSLRRVVPSQNTPVICADEELAAWHGEPGGNPPDGTSPSDLAYVIYTSGSTGKPKGVEISHGAVSNFLHAMRREPGLSSGDSVLALTTLSFDIAVFEILLTLSVGARIVLVGREASVDPQLLRRKVELHRPTVMQATPATWRMLLDVGWQGGSNLRIITGGEALSEDLAEQLLDRCDILWNGYGPTEATVYATMWRVERGRHVLIGKPVANTRAYVLDSHLRLAPIGIPGELCLGGIQLACGYRGRPDLTAEKFVPDPFSGNPGDRLYRTGDLVRLREGGSIDYLGRMDHQVKIRGFRIELGEIEVVLREHTSVAKAVVVARDDGAGRQLVAYVVPAADCSVDWGELRGMLKRKLPDYMIPAHLVVLDRLPMTPNGKIDRMKLPSPSHLDQLRSEELVRPRDWVEQQLVEIWESVLKVEPIGIRDDFFQLGGDSLSAVRVVVRVEQVFDRNLPLVTLFQTPTIEEMAAEIREHRLSKHGCLVPIQTHGTRLPIFLVHGLGGNVLGYQSLCKWLSPVQPVYGLQAVGLDGSQPPLTDVPEMARRYAEEVRKVQPHGPYVLGGLSLGGIIALEMAAQLRSAGEPVSTLLLLDAYAYGVERLEPSGTRFWRVLGLLGRRIRLHTRNISQLGVSGKVAYVRKKVHTLRRRLRWRISAGRYQSFLRGAGELPQVYDSVAQAAWKAVKAYTPAPLAIDALLVRADGEPFLRNNDSTLGWSRIIRGRLVTCTVPGDHLSLLTEPNVRDAATELLKYLEEHHNWAATRGSTPPLAAPTPVISSESGE